MLKHVVGSGQCLRVYPGVCGREDESFRREKKMNQKYESRGPGNNAVFGSLGIPYLDARGQCYTLLSPRRGIGALAMCRLKSRLPDTFRLGV